MNGDTLGCRLLCGNQFALAWLLALSWMVFDVSTAAAQAKAPCKEMRKIKLGVSVSPPNVVHTPV